MNSNIRKSIYNIFFGIGSQILIAIVGIVIPKLFISNFGSEVNGFLSSINQIFSYVILLEAGVGTATLQALYKPVAENDYDGINGIMSATAKFYRRTGWCYLACIGVLSIIYPICVSSELPVWEQTAIILVTGGSGSIGYFIHAKYRMLMHADGKTYIYTNAYTLVQLGTNVIKIVMIALDMNIVFVQLGHMVLMLLLALYIHSHVKRNYPWINLAVEPNTQAISQKKNVLVHEVSQMIFNHTDILLLTAFTDLKQVSVYTIYSTIVDIISTLIQNVHNGFSFRLGQIFNTDIDRFKRTYRVYETIYMMASMAVYCVTLVFLTPFMKLYMGDVTDVNYLDPILPMLFISIKVLVSGRALASSTISYAGKFKDTQHHAVIEMVINLSCSLVAVNFIGMYGVLLGTIAALLYRSNQMIFFARKILHESVWKTYGRWVLNLGIFVAVFFLCRAFPIEADNYLSLVLYAVVYTTIILFIFTLSNLMVFPKVFKFLVVYAKKALGAKIRKNIS